MKSLNLNISNTRNLSIDLVKIIAMSLVVCLHTTHRFINNEFNINYILYNLSVAAIPLFFMVSGYLLLGRKNLSYSYSFKKIVAILRFTVIFIGLWWFVISFIKGFDLNRLIANYFGAFIQKGTFGVFWYFGTMIIIYLLYPVINKIYFKKKIFLVLFFLLLVIQSLVFNWNIAGNGELNFIQSLRLWNWISYFMLGGILKGFNLNKNFLVLTIIVSAVVFINVSQWLYPMMKTNLCEYFYSSLLILGYVSAIFLLCKDIKIKDSKIIRSLSELFLPVYALHMFVIEFLFHFGRTNIFLTENRGGG